MFGTLEQRIANDDKGGQYCYRYQQLAALQSSNIDRQLLASIRKLIGRMLQFSTRSMFPNRNSERHILVLP